MLRNQLLEMFPVWIGPDAPERQLYGRFRRVGDPISAIVGGVASIASGIIGSNAASKAATIQQQAATAAGQQVINTANQVNPSITNAATTAGTGLTDAATAAGQNAVSAATAAGNQTTTAAQLAGTQATTAAQAAGTGATTTAQQGAAGATTAAQQAAAGVTGAATSANALLNPYAAAGAQASGTLAAGLTPGGAFNSSPTMAQLQIDPGYAFRLQQGEKALSSNAAASGSVMGGGAAKALAAFGQSMGSQEYQNAFNRFQTSTQNRYSNLLNVSNSGQNAAGAQGQNTIGAATYGGNIQENAAQYGGNLNENASQFAGNQNVQATEFAGSQNVAGAEYAGTANTQASQYAGTAAQNAAAQGGQWNVNAADIAGQNLINASTQAANYNTSGAAAQAAGVVGSANAWTGALGGLAKTATASQGLNLLQNPSSGYTQLNPTGTPRNGPYGYGYYGGAV